MAKRDKRDSGNHTPDYFEEHPLLIDFEETSSSEETPSSTEETVAIKKTGRGKHKLPTRLYRNNLHQQGASEIYAVKSEDGTNPYLECSLEIAALPPVDLYDPDAVQERVVEYFRIHAKYGIDPTVVALAMCLGIDRYRLYEIVYGAGASSGHRLAEKIPARSRHIVKTAYQIKENLWEGWMREIRGNPAAAIFLGKNHFGYEDKTEYILTPHQETTDYSQAEIRERLGLPEDSSDSVDS